MIERFKLLRFRGIVNFEIIVRIEAAERCHAEDRARVYVHNKRKAAVFNRIAVDCGLQILFQIILHRGIDRKNEVVAVGCIVILLIGIEHRRSVVAARFDHFAGIALKRCFVVRFQSLAADVVFVYKAEHLRRKRSIGIIPLLRRLHVDALHAGCVDVFQQLIRRFLRDLLADRLIGVVRIKDALQGRIAVNL